MFPMSDSKSQPRRPSTPIPALQAAMSGVSANPVRHALWLDALEQQLRPCLPPQLAPHCRLANVAGGRLVFLVDSPVWRARLRLAAPELINLARSFGLEVTEATAKVGTLPTIPGPASPRKPRPLSAATHDALQAALASLEGPDSAEPEKTTHRR
ncbi:MAG: DciA family protein [Pseudoxanthomonas sp.]